MIKHIVCWKLNGTPEEREAIIRHFSVLIDGLRPILPEIRSAVIGVNLLEGDQFHLCYDSVFDNEEDLNRYQYHPEHVKVKDYMATVSYDKMVFDYVF